MLPARKTPTTFVVGVFLRGQGLERAAPVRTLVQKLRAGEQFLARGKVHGSLNAGSMPVGRDPLFVAELYRRSTATSSKTGGYTYLCLFLKDINANKSLCPFYNVIIAVL